jgi:hypothetical protein
MKVQSEQEVQWVFGGPQASSCADANIIVIRQAPVHLTTILEFILFFFYLIYDSWMCVRL